MKKPDEQNPYCPFCKNQARKKGKRKNKNRIIQKYQCRKCKKYFTTQSTLQKSKRYPIKLILSIISNLNLGYSLKQTQSYFKGKKHKQKKKIPRSTLSYWYNQLRAFLPYHRIRNTIKTSYKPINIIKKKRFIHYNQPFSYKYHQPKLDLFLKSYPRLKNYLENIEKILPKGIFNSSKRISQQKPTKHNLIITKKQNYATTLANIALQITQNNKERHNIIENFMLINDTATIAAEIPIFIKEQNLTGHIDILQIRYNKIYILDYKPEPINKQQAITQLLLYRKALSQLTNIKEQKIRLAFFNHKYYHELSHPQDL